MNFGLTWWILLLWVGKCLAELMLIYVSLSHRVRYVWALGLYTFTTTLILMMMVGVRFSNYGLADHLVSVGGGGLMLLVAMGLVRLLLRGKRWYGGVTAAHLALCLSQLVVFLFTTATGRTNPVIVNLVGMGSWIGAITWLTWQSYMLPPENLKAMDVGRMMLRDFTD